MNIQDGVIIPEDTIIMTRDVEVAYLAGGGKYPVQLLAFNNHRLLAVMEGGQIVAAIATQHPDHGRLCGAERHFKFVQAARSWFYNHVGTAER